MKRTSVLREPNTNPRVIGQRLEGKEAPDLARTRSSNPTSILSFSFRPARRSLCDRSTSAASARNAAANLPDSFHPSRRRTGC